MMNHFEIEEILKKCNIQGNYRINSDLSVDIIGTIRIKPIIFLRLSCFSLPFKFNEITEDFDISGCNLVDSKNFPNSIKGSLLMNNNLIKSYPKDLVVGRDIHVDFNKSIDLKNLQENINGDFSATNCLLYQFTFDKLSVKGHLDLSFNSFKAFSDKIKFVGDGLNLSDNLISTEIINQDRIKGFIDLSNNPINLSDEFEKAIGNFNS